MDYGRLNLALLVFLRVSGLVVSSPLFGRKNLPNMAKIGFCAALTYLFFMEGVDPNEVIVYDNFLVLVLLCVKELLFGVVLGFISYLFMNLTFTTGQLVDMQMGFGMVSILDVQSNISVPVTGNLLNIAILITFFAVNGHYRLIQIVYATLEAVPVGSVSISGNLAVTAVEVFSMSFLLATNVSFPIIAAGLITEIALGVIIRSVPQLNVFSIGYPIKIILGFIMILVLIPIFIGFTSTIFDEMFVGLEKMFAAMMG